MTAHDDIDDLLAADLHGDLSEAERTELHVHLVECAACRQTYQENKHMNKMLEETLVAEKPDAAFEQRVLANFRQRVPEKSHNIVQLITDLMRLRSAQIAGVAALLLALLQVGRVVTNEPLPMRHSETGRVIVTGGNIPAAEEVGPNPVLKMNRDLINKPGERRTGQSFSEPSQAPATAEPAPPGSMAAAGATGRLEDQGQLAAKSADKQDAIAQLESQSLSVQSAPAAPPVKGKTFTPPASAESTSKLIRNARVDLEIVSFDDAVSKITQFANEEGGYVATSGSQKQQNGKLHGDVIVKVRPQNLDRFLQKVRGLGELKNQTVGTEDVTKQYFDTDARLKNARVMEQRLLDMLKTKTGKVTDLLQVERELGRVREEIEKMQGELKYWDSQVQLATVTISLAEKDLEEPAAFLLQEHAQLSLFVSDVEKTYNEVRSLASPKIQITDARLERDNSGRVVAHVGMLIVPDESGRVIDQIKEKGRIDNFQDQTSRVAQGGEPAAAGSENAKTRRDKVDFAITITRETDEHSVQQTSLRILTKNVDQNAARLKEQATKSGAEVRNSTFSRDPNGREVANISLRLPIKNYATMMESFKQLGEVKDVQVERQDRIGKNLSEATAPADISIQMYSEGDIVPANTGLFATLRNTLAQGAGALMWSVRMIGVAIAFLAPWTVALVALIWVARRAIRSRRKL